MNLRAPTRAAWTTARGAITRCPKPNGSSPHVYGRLMGSDATRRDAMDATRWDAMDGICQGCMADHATYNKTVWPAMPIVTIPVIE